MHRPHMMHRDRPNPPDQRNRSAEIHIAVRRIHRPTEHAIGMVIERRALVTAGNDHQRPVLNRHVIEHHAHRRQIVVGVRVERPVLMPLHRRSEPGAFHVQLRRIEPDMRPPQRLQHANDPWMPGQRRIRRIVQMRSLDPPNPRPLRRMAVLQIVDRVMRRQPPRPLHEPVGDIA